MGLFGFRRRNTSSIAKDRLKLLLNAERINCSPSVLIMLKNDLIKTVNKYIVVDEDKVSVKYTAAPPSLTAHIPIDEASKSGIRAANTRRNR